MYFMNFYTKLGLVKKFGSIYRRLFLGDRFKHQYTCHPDFDISREKNHCKVFFKGQLIADIPYSHKLSNQFSGACFTVATGPSLADVNLELIKAYDTISLNCAITKFNAQNIKPTHCVIIDRRIFENQWDCVRASILSGANCFFSYVGLSRICEKEPELLQRGNIYLIESISRKYGVPRFSIDECKQDFLNDADVYLDNDLIDYCRVIGFSSSLEKGLFSGKTVATWATQLVPCLGYQNHFILGMDLGGTGKKHFYENENNGSPDFIKDYEPYIRSCFELASKVYIEKDLGIYNLSEKSTLPDSIIKKITIEQALEIAHNSH